MGILKSFSRWILRKEIADVVSNTERLQADNDRLYRILALRPASATMLPKSIVKAVVDMLPDANAVMAGRVSVAELKTEREVRIMVPGRGEVTCTCRFVDGRGNLLEKVLKDEEGAKTLAVEVAPIGVRLYFPLIRRENEDFLGGIAVSVNTWAWDLRNANISFIDDAAFAAILDFILASQAVRNDLLGIKP